MQFDSRIALSKNIDIRIEGHLNIAMLNRSQPRSISVHNSIHFYLLLMRIAAIDILGATK